MAVTRIEIHSRSPLAGGRSFGDAGPYERLDGRIHFAVDPAHDLNQGIVDLDRAARGADGRVHFTADLCLLQPVDGARASGQLLYEVSNRGRRGVLGRLNRPAARGQRPPPEAATSEEAGGMPLGDGLLLRQGWIIAWSGWQWDVIRDRGLIGFDAPAALDDRGQPIQGQVMLQWQVDTPSRDHLLADRIHHPYAAADVDDPEATLIAMEWPDGPRRVLPRDRWRFARDEGGTPVADDTHVWSADGFEPGVIYQLVYRTRVCPVVGTGLLAVRDAVSFLRYGSAVEGNPSAGRIRHTFGFGSSQSGRFLRNFLYLGLNVDEVRRRVFDGLLINVAGARRGEFNHRYAQPSVIPAHSFGHRPPFAFEAQTDPLTGETDGLLLRQRSRSAVLPGSHASIIPSVPKIVATNTSSEYWNRAASLLHTDLAGTRDVEPPPEVRVYHFAGTKHAPGTLPGGGRRRSGPHPNPLPLGEGGPHPSPRSAGEGASPYRVADDSGYPAQMGNVLDFNPLLRTAFCHLVDWVIEGKEPPPSVFPRLADGTAAPLFKVLAFFHRLPGVRVPDPERLWQQRRLDLGPEAARGVGRFPAKLGEPYPYYAPALDDDGNERAGIPLPDISVPVATHTGWFPRRPGTGGEGQNVDMQGCTIPFAPTADARRQAGDPRPAIAERYCDRDDYLARVRAATQRLVEQRHLLPEEVDLVVANAMARYDAFA